MRTRPALPAVTSSNPMEPETVVAALPVREELAVGAAASLDSRWQVAGAAVKGISHERTGAPCQDAQGYQVLPDGLLIVALADGAGSARFSDEGARTAVEEALRVLSEAGIGSANTKEDWEERMRDVFLASRQAVIRLAEESGEWLRDYASTLTCVAATEDWLAVGQVGDGAVVAMDQDGELFAATYLQRGEYANETHFLVQEDALDRLAVEFIERPVRALAVMSDGLIRLALKMPSQEPHAPFFQPLFGFIQSVGDGAGGQEPSEVQAKAAAQLAAFLGSERVNARTDDDKSLVLAAPIMLQKPSPLER